MDAVAGFVKRAPLTSSLRRHCLQMCYKCGSADWKRCSCRRRIASPAMVGTSTVSISSSSSSSTSLPPVIVVKKQVPLLPLVMKSRSGQRPPTVRTRPIGRQAKRKSGRPRSGAQRLKDLGIPKDHDHYKAFKYGSNPDAVRKKANKKQYLRTRPASAKREQVTVVVSLVVIFVAKFQVVGIPVE